jgi:uncharacterized protein YecT (DUF1311 family)
MFKFGFSIFALALCPAVVMAKPAAQTGYAHFTLSTAAANRMQSHTYTACLAEAGGVTASIRECIGAEFERIDERLNASYKTAMQRISVQFRAMLRREERTWLKTRLAACERDLAEDKGGTIWLIEMDDCALREHIRRTAWIERIRV